jgi:hypothetical protein
MILNLRLAPDGSPRLLTIDATDEMQEAVKHLQGRDLDVTVQKGAEQLRFTARWGSPEFLQVLARYLVNNFGWKTKISETQLLSATNTTSGSGSFVAYSGTVNNGPSPSGLTARMFANLSIEDPKQRPQLSLVLTNTATSLTVDRE